MNATALYIASSYSQSDIIEWLIENGADPSVASFCGQKPVDVIGQCYRGSNEIIKQIKLILEKPRKGKFRHVLLNSSYGSLTIFNSESPKVFKAPLAPTTAAKAAPEDVFVTEYQEIPSGQSIF